MWCGVVLGFWGMARWLLTSVEWWDFAIVACPEVVALVFCVLGRVSGLFVGILSIHRGLYLLRKLESRTEIE